MEEFEITDDSIENTKVFKSYNLEPAWAKETLLSAIREIIKENQPEVILLSTTSLFMKAVHFSKKSEMDPKMTVTEDRTPVYYAMVGEDNCTLLIAWNKYEDEEE